MTRIRFAGQDCGDTFPIRPGERGLLLGDGVFETILTLNGVPVWLSEHLDRIMSAVSVLGLRAERADLEREVRAVAGREPGIIRLTVMRGEASRGLGSKGTGASPVLASFSPLPDGLINSPVRLAVPAVRRNEGSPSSRMKTLSYMDNILAAREAAARGADDALMLNNSGCVASVSVGNIFIIRGQKLITPAISEGALAGIARKRVLECAQGAGLEPSEGQVKAEDVKSADAVFMTNSLRLISPVTELDGMALKNSAAGVVDRMFAMLCENIVSETGCNPSRPGDKG